MKATTTSVALFLSWAGPFCALTMPQPRRVSARLIPTFRSKALKGTQEEEFDRLLREDGLTQAAKYFRSHPDLDMSRDRITKLLATAEKATTSSTPPKQATPEAPDTSTSFLGRTFRKCKGANAKSPPAFSWGQTGWTFSGAFVTLMILTNMNKLLVENFGGKYAIVLGPFGALMTLMFGLTAAPATQPRNAILGQIYSLSIAYSIGKMALPVWSQQSLATSLAIAVMVKTGTTHPPAGAAALLFSTGSQSLTQVAMMLAGNVVAILCATLINNMSASRQYPTTWGLGKLRNLLGLEKSEKSA